MLKNLQFSIEEKNVIRVIVENKDSADFSEILRHFEVEYEVGTHTTGKETYYDLNLEELFKNLKLFIKFSR
jgi:hypothetical protein